MVVIRMRLTDRSSTRREPEVSVPALVVFGLGLVLFVAATVWVAFALLTGTPLLAGTPLLNVAA